MPETPFALYTDRNVQMIVSLLDILKAGGTYLPIDAAMAADRAAFILNDTAAPLFDHDFRLVFASH